MNSINAKSIDSRIVTQTHSEVEAKPFWKSTGFWGIMITLIVSINIPVSKILEKEEITALDIWQIVQVLGASSLALLGRVNATQPLTLGGKKDISSITTPITNTTEIEATSISVNNEHHSELTDGF